MKDKYFNMLDLKRECCECEEVDEIVNNICEFINKVNSENFEELVKEYEYEIGDFWGGYMVFLKEEYYNKLENLGLLKIFE